MLADEIHDRPAALALRHIPKLQPRQLPPPEAASHQQPQQNPVPQPFVVSGSGEASSCWAWGRVSQLPVRTPERRAPGTPRIPAAASGESPPFAAASDASLRSAAMARLIEAADRLRSRRCER